MRKSVSLSILGFCLVLFWTSTPLLGLTQALFKENSSELVRLEDRKPDHKAAIEAWDTLSRDSQPSSGTVNSSQPLNYWKKFRIHGAVSSDLTLVFDQRQHPYVAIYEWRDQGLVLLGESGAMVRPADRSLRIVDSHLLIPAADKDVRDLLLVVHAPLGRVNTNFEVMTLREVLTQSERFHQILGLYYGIAFFLIALHLFNFYSTRTRISLLYATLLVVTVSMTMTIDGFMDFYLPFDGYRTWLVDIASLQAFALSILTISFVRRVFSTKRYFPRIDRTIFVFKATTICLFLSSPLLPQATVMLAFDGLGLVGLVYTMGIAAYIWRSGYLPAAYLLASRIVFSLLLIISILGRNQILPNTSIYAYFFHMGTLAEMIIMTFGFGFQIKNLQDQKRHLEENERMATVRINWFNTLIRAITHDVATPIAVISSTAELELMQKPDDPNLVRNMNRILRATQQQTALIAAVRNMVAVVTGKKNLELSLVSLQTLMIEAIHLHSEAAAKKGIKIRCQIRDPHLQVETEPTVFVQTILSNFISNAIKFSPPGSNVELSARREEANVSIRIQDYGIGIPSDLIDKIFDPVQSTSRRGTDNEIGTGFGLPIAKAYVEYFHGHIRVMSVEKSEFSQDSGTTFELTFPLAAHQIKKNPRRRNPFAQRTA